MGCLPCGQLMLQLTFDANVASSQYETKGARSERHGGTITWPHHL